MNKKTSRADIIENATSRFLFISKTLYKVAGYDPKVHQAVSKVMDFLMDKQIVSNDEFINLDTTD